MGQIKLNYVLILNWIVWDSAALIFEMRKYAKLICFKKNFLDI